MSRALIVEIAGQLERLRNIDAKLGALIVFSPERKHWQEQRQDAIERIEDASKRLPSGSGFDNDSTVEIDECKPDRIVIASSYHHMSEGGYYDGWSDFRVVVRPSFTGPLVDVLGRTGQVQRRYWDRDFRDYIAETFLAALEGETT
jgi:hypothetical protein